MTADTVAAAVVSRCRLLCRAQSYSASPDAKRSTRNCGSAPSHQCRRIHKESGRDVIMQLLVCHGRVLTGQLQLCRSASRSAPVISCEANPGQRLGKILGVRSRAVEAKVREYALSPGGAPHARRQPVAPAPSRGRPEWHACAQSHAATALRCPKSQPQWASCPESASPPRAAVRPRGIERVLLMALHVVLM